MFQELKKLQASCDIFICHTTEGNLADFKALLPDAGAFFPQHGQCLGEKMHNSIRHVLEKGYGRCLLIGSDLPLIRAEAAADAFDMLGTHDVVLCPTEDGGYYLIGMKEPCEGIFQLQYGNTGVFKGTLALIEQHGKTWAAGKAAMDVDNPQDLARLAQKLKSEDTSICPNTRAVLEKFAKRRKFCGAY
jgi:glycosyltransferase A (GT-A) superfamily protein (DUF2064 family)